MKKNAMLKIAAVLLVAVLLTTCAISSTFAKYATDGEIYNEQARVAKWGLNVNIDAEGTNKIFSDKYAGGNVAALGTGELVMAPGTEGSLNITNVVTGTAEVSAEVRFYVTAVKTGFNANNNYMPITVTAGGETITISADDNWQQVGDAITVAPNTEVNAGDEFTITWNWAFGEDGANDAKDTALGEAGETNTLRIKVKAEIVQTRTSVEAEQQ
jgi:hypothetical protein